MKFESLKIILILIVILFTPVILPINALNIENSNLTYEYYSYQQMTDLLQNLQQKYPDIYKLESYGKTHENRDIWLVKISDNVEIDEKDEPGILLLGAHHGDEKISYEILLYFIKYMNENYEKEDRVKNVVNNTQIFIIPMINPDGVEANQRKNCNPDKEHGVNTNRNFGYDWKYYDLFPDIFHKSWALEETSGNYRGTSPNSENETKAIIKVAESFTVNISLSYHSGAEVIFFPWYHTTEKTLHESLFIKIGKAMEKISGYPLWTGSNPIIPKFGGTLGTSENYLYGEHKILAYTVESARQKAPTYSDTVLNICNKNVDLHLYLCEKAQTIDNNKDYVLKSHIKSLPLFFYLIYQKILI